MLLEKGEDCKILKGSDKISFSKDVAETLGVESAIILELYQTQKNIKLKGYRCCYKVIK